MDKPVAGSIYLPREQLSVTKFLPRERQTRSSLSNSSKRLGIPRYLPARRLGFPLSGFRFGLATRLLRIATVELLCRS